MQKVYKINKEFYFIFQCINLFPLNWKNDILVFSGRGIIVADYVTNDLKLSDYVECIKEDANKYNDFVFVSVELEWVFLFSWNYSIHIIIKIFIIL